MNDLDSRDKYAKLRLDGNKESIYGKDYYSGDNKLTPFDMNSFTDKDVYPNNYVNILVEIFPDLRESQTKALDVGCCMGAYTREMLRHGCDAVGIDFSEFAFSRRQIPEHRFLNHDLTKPLPFKDEHFDFILANDILEHFFEEDSLNLAQEIRRVLKKNSYAVINVGTGECPEHLFLKERSWWQEYFNNSGFAVAQSEIDIFFRMKNMIPMFKESTWPNFFIVRRVF